MLKRTITALVGILIFIPICLFSGTLVFPVAVAVVTVIAIYEMMKCIGANKDFSLIVPVYILAVGVPMSVRFFAAEGKFVIVYSSVLFLLMLYFFAASVFARGKYKLEKVAMIYMTSVYIITAFTSIILLRDMTSGKYIYLLAIIGPWVSDIFAYLCGTTCAKFFTCHKLIPEVSANKTIEGSVGGIISCGLLFALYGVVVSFIYDTQPEYIALILAGILVSIISQIGDLTASLIKRQYFIKDYGNLFPGHGGVMDRFDSVLATAPFLLIICSIPQVFTLFF